MITRKKPSKHLWPNFLKYNYHVLAVRLHKLLRNTFSAPVSGAVFFISLSFFLSITCHSRELPEINKYISNGGYALTKNGKTVYSKNLRDAFIPASTIKLITSLAAIEILGPDFHFHTYIYFNQKSKTLYIKGSGDPYLVSEKVHEIIKDIAAKGILVIHDIVLDDSAFTLEHVETKGSDNSQNPYDANCSALAVNFNTLPLKVLHRAKIKSPERQTPYLPIMGQIGKELSSGYHRINIDAFPKYSSLPNRLLYCGQLFKTLLIRQGIHVSGKIKQGQIPPLTPLLHHYIAKESVNTLVEACLLSSNNFMANQLYLAIGVERYGFPATWKKSQKAMNAFLHNFLGLTGKQINMVEGSGLSTENIITPEAMIQVLEKFKPYASLIPIKYGVRMKSGTLRKSGVFCYAGYITKGKHQNPFVILLNQKRNGRDKILKVLYSQ
jgi:serine-type D-Ala-D-Ala carboxypeptidase/endopeptidase (penicillin-binding protein 4)